MAFPDFEKALDTTDEIELTTTHRRSGREVSHPVWFVREGETLSLLPVRGSDTRWYRNVLKNPMIRLAAGGTERSARATPVTDPGKVHEVVENFRARYGAGNVKTYYPKVDVAVEVPPA
jgi:hypothetical protein